MALSRRALMAGLAAAPAIGTAQIGTVLAADTYPSKPIRLIVGFVPGGGSDLVARIIAEALGSRLGQTVIVENKPGASTSIALDYVAKSAPDGYTIGHATPDGTTMMTALKPHMAYDVGRDFTYLSRLVQLDFVLVVNTKQPYKTLPEMVAYAKANPGKIRYGSIGVGSGTHLATLLLMQQAKIDMTHVPYKGGDAVLIDLLSGVIDIGFLTLANVKEYHSSEKIRVIAVTSDTREPTWPEIQTMKEAGYAGATVYSWQALVAPAKLPAPVQDKLDKALADALADAAVKKRLETLGFRTAPLPAAGLRKLVLEETNEWRRVAKAAKLSLS